MKTTLATCLCIFVALSGLQSGQPRGWKGLVPLHSKRADVERLLGRSPEKCNCFYETASEKISIQYSQGPCKGFLSGWNVPADTVLMITVRPNAEILLSDLSSNVSKLDESSGTDTPGLYYTDKDAGIRFSVRESGIVTAIDYIPKRGDYSLRCKGFPSIPDLGHREFRPFDSYSNIPLGDEHARLDNFSISIHDQADTKGYILFYASKEVPAKKARIRAHRAKDYLVKRRNMQSKRIDVIEGGYREQFEIELYILPSNANPPAPHPTIVPREFGMNKSDKVRRNERTSDAPR